MKKIVITVLAVGVLLGLAFFALNSFIYNEKQADQTIVPEPYQATLSGTQVCLPHKGDGPHTKECAAGMKTDTGEFYALDFALMAQYPPQLGEGRFTAQGVITPVEYLSSDQWQKYDIVGIFSVTMITPENPVSTDGGSDPATQPGAVMTAAVTSIGVQALTQGLMLTPLEVVSDSRCASDVQCIWAGTIQVKTKLQTFTNDSTEIVMELGAAPQTFGDYSVRLLDASPAPVSTKQIAPSEYRLTYEIVKIN